MLSLLQNVLPHRFNRGLAHTKSAVARLPREILEPRPTLVSPSRGISFDQADDIGAGVCRGHSNEQMDVVGGTVDAECDSADFSDDAAQIRVEISFDLRSNHRR